MEISLPENIEKLSDSEIIDMLEPQINLLINSDFQKLKQILYRLDVNESKVIRVYSKFQPSDWAKQIALLIWEREKERMKWRSRYQAPDL
jgi:hypothetical protein